MNNVIKRVGTIVAACGLPPRMPLGSVLGSVLAVPLLMALRFIYYLSPAACCVLFIVMAASMVVATCIATQIYDEPVLFASDKVIGLLLALVRMTPSIKILLVAFFLFHGVRVAIPLLLRNTGSFDLQAQSSWVTVISPSIMAGVVCNIILHIVVWVGA